VDHQAKIDRALAANGYLFGWEQLQEWIESGEAVQWTVGESTFIMRTVDYALKRAVEVLLVAGRAEDLPEWSEKVREYAKAVGASVVLANGRRGFKAVLPKGWRPLTSTYVMEVDP